MEDFTALTYNQYLAADIICVTPFETAHDYLKAVGASLDAASL
jgi:hypothetical protein